MVVAANSVSRFVNSHPTLKMLALSFLLLIGMALVADGMGQEIEKGYIYFAMGFSVFVEILNLRVKAKKVPLHPRGVLLCRTPSKRRSCPWRPAAGYAPWTPTEPSLETLK